MPEKSKGWHDVLWIIHMLWSMATLLAVYLKGNGETSMAHSFQQSNTLTLSQILSKVKSKSTLLSSMLYMHDIEHK